MSRYSGRTSLTAGSWALWLATVTLTPHFCHASRRSCKGGVVEFAAAAHDKRHRLLLLGSRLEFVFEGLAHRLLVHTCSILPDRHETGKGKGPFIPRLKAGAFWPFSVSLHQVEEVEGIGVIRLGRPRDAHHQHEVHDAVRGVARLPEAVERYLPERTVDVAVGYPVRCLAVEVWIRAVGSKLAGPPTRGRDAGADDGHAGLARPRFDQLAQQSTQMNGRHGWGSGGATILV